MADLLLFDLSTGCIGTQFFISNHPLTLDRLPWLFHFFSFSSHLVCLDSNISNWDFTTLECWLFSFFFSKRSDDFSYDSNYICFTLGRCTKYSSTFHSYLDGDFFPPERQVNSCSFQATSPSLWRSLTVATTGKQEQSRRNRLPRARNLAVRNSAWKCERKQSQNYLSCLVSWHLVLVQFDNIDDR